MTESEVTAPAVGRCPTCDKPVESMSVDADPPMVTRRRGYDKAIPTGGAVATLHPCGHKTRAAGPARTIVPTAADIARDTYRRLIVERIERFKQASAYQPTQIAFAGLGGQTNVVNACPLCRSLVEIPQFWGHWRGHEIDAQLDRETLETL